jgi:excisionase family DNA binding protein
MNDRFEYKKVCKSCGKTFTAYQSTTKYCSPNCATRGYKAKKRKERLQADSEEIKERNRQNLLSQEYLSLTNAAALLGISRPTIYKIIADGELKTIRVSERIVRVRKSDLEKLQSKTLAPIKHTIAEINKTVEEYISVEEALLQFKISNTWFYRKIQENKITPITIKGKAHYPVYSLRKLFAKKEYSEIVEWCTVKELMSIYSASMQFVYDFTSRNKLPRKREGRITLISKFHWDKAQGNDPTEKGLYYTVPEITEKYEMNRDRVYELISWHKIPKIKHGRLVMISREHFDKLMNNRKKQ